MQVLALIVAGIIALILYTPLYLPVILCCIFAFRKSWEFAFAFGAAWFATIITRAIALADWHPVDGGVSQSFRDASINLYWMWKPSIIAHAVCCTIAIILVSKKNKRKEQNAPNKTQEGIAEELGKPSE